MAKLALGKFSAQHLTVSEVRTLVSPVTALTEMLICAQHLTVSEVRTHLISAEIVKAALFVLNTLRYQRLGHNLQSTPD